MIEKNQSLEKDINAIYQNKEYLIVNKPAGLLSQGSQDSEDIHLLSLLENKHKKQFHLLSRLDRPVSGLAILSKNTAFNKHYQNIQNMGVVKKSYIALVEGLVKEDSITLNNFLCHDRRSKKSVVSNDEKENFKEASLSIKTLARLDRYSIIEAEILRGKFHQIRSQLAHWGYPVKGDVKYGARRSNKDRSIHLHSYKISFMDRYGEEQCYKAEFPKNDNLWKIIDEKIKA